MAKFCTHCGNPLSPDDKFCMKCGAPITSSVTAPIKPDPKIKAAEWFQRGMAYLDGNGIEQDFKKADNAFQKSFGFGNKQALSWVGIARLYQSAAILRGSLEAAQEAAKKDEIMPPNVQKTEAISPSDETNPVSDTPLPVIPEKQ